MTVNRRLHTTAISRRGSMVPALAFALLVVGGSLALTFDRLWQDTAAIELQTAGEAAALAAARALASDATLQADPDWEDICEVARTAAAKLAAENATGDVAVHLNASSRGDIRLGSTLENSVGESIFVESTQRPRTAVVRARQGRGSRNPLGLLVRDLTGAGRSLEVIVAADAENRVVGVRPFEGATVPALPIAIFAGTAGTPGWSTLVEGHLGPDTFSHSRGLESSPDGLSEMIVTSVPQQADPKQQLAATLHLIDLGKGLSESTLQSQCRDGWSMEDLESHGGEIRFDDGAMSFTSLPKIPAGVGAELKRLVGQTRLCWLFDSAQPTANPGRCQVHCPRLVGIRILDVQNPGDGLVVVTLQGATIVTRTALVSDEANDQFANPYLYKVFLVH